MAIKLIMCNKPNGTMDAHTFSDTIPVTYIATYYYYSNRCGIVSLVLMYIFGCFACGLKIRYVVQSLFNCSVSIF